MRSAEQLRPKSGKTVRGGAEGRGIAALSEAMAQRERSVGKDGAARGFA